MAAKAKKAKVEVGKKLPAFKAPAAGAKQDTLGLSDYSGSCLVIYFYPRDHTSGCTAESAEFAANHGKFRRAGCHVLGVSRDTLASHQRFIDKLDLPFPLLSDSDEKLCEMFSVMVDKNMYGKKVRGIERSTFLADGKGVLRQEWRKVKVEGHVQEVLAAAKALGK